MLQNRVTPFGEIVRNSSRGTFTGTRGMIHNQSKTIERPFRHKAWITCLLEFKNRKRVVMSPNRYTELFFLDEATAFAAGHRPCAECRRSAFNSFKLHWLKGNPQYGFNAKTSINEIDTILHQERIDEKKLKVTFAESPSDLPDGTFVTFNNEGWLIQGTVMHRWTPFGYHGNAQVPATGKLDVLTPRSIVNAFRSGYRPLSNLP